VLVISNQPHASHSSDFEITRVITPLSQHGPVTITNNNSGGSRRGPQGLGHPFFWVKKNLQREEKAAAG